MVPVKRPHTSLPASGPDGSKRTKLALQIDESEPETRTISSDDDGASHNGPVKDDFFESEQFTCGGPEAGSGKVTENSDLGWPRISVRGIRPNRRLQVPSPEGLGDEAPRGTETSNLETNTHTGADNHATPMGTSFVSPEMKSALQKLPLEILWKVAEFMPVTDLNNLVRTCQKVKGGLEQRLYQNHSDRAIRWASSKRTKRHLQEAKPVAEKFAVYTANMTFLDNGLTPLMVVARYGYLHGFETLLDCVKKTDVNRMTGPICLDTKARSATAEPNAVGWTALTLAARYGHHAILRRLLEYEGIDTSVVSTKFEKRGGTAQKRGFAPLVQENFYQNRGNALFWATQRYHEECVLALLQSPQITPTAEEIKQLRETVERANEPDIYKHVRWMLEECQENMSTESRLDRFQGLTTSEVADLEFQRWKEAYWEPIGFMGI